MKRFFLSTLAWNGGGMGQVFTETEGCFLSGEEVIKHKREDANISGNIIITNIFEFKSEQDYLDFKKEK